MKSPGELPPQPGPAAWEVALRRGLQLHAFLRQHRHARGRVYLAAGWKKVSTWWSLEWILYPKCEPWCC